MSPRWHQKAKRMRAADASLSEIAEACEVSAQAVSIALDPEKQDARRAYVAAWNRKRRANPKFRAAERKRDAAAKRLKRAGE